MSTGSVHRKVHSLLSRAFFGFLVLLAAAIFLSPEFAASDLFGIFLGSLAVFPHFALGTKIWHEEGRNGIGIPIALMGLRFAVCLILLSVILWQFPTERRIIGWSVGFWVIVLTPIETFLFAKGVGRL